MEADVRTFIAHADDKVKQAGTRGRDMRLFSPLTMKFIEEQRERLKRLDEDCHAL